MKKLLRKLIALGISRLPRGLLIDIEFFDLFQSKGWHVVPNHFYDPIPDTSRLPDSLWERPSEMAGIDQNIKAQVNLLDEIAGTYLREYQKIGAEDPVSAFAGIDGAMLYSLIRKLKPRRMIEIGSGASTLLSLRALQRNREDASREGEFTAIEPYPSDAVRKALREKGTLIEEKVEDLPPALFETLGENDILFIDSSHSVKIGSDVLYEILEILPRLKEGVHIHIHDIFLPYHYPKDWVKGRKIFWTEQYLLQAFLACNRDFEILWSPGSLWQQRPERLTAHFPGYDPARHPAGSFWMRRCR
ncbi:MAG: class I SAM-dependent methyltransferase [Gammaproteobacteria bacterium]|nr:class I SAM-dependent methyltransferase [Gammaproteobacteria bacterium]MBU1655733.1 class I SAM-dependent methyltransferase [Gammaproteobacteria bacterium]MBU1960105.1 class I SAM-dependent methyltransferase [Gammaproteobacteria bacterium]